MSPEPHVCAPLSNEPGKSLVKHIGNEEKPGQVLESTVTRQNLVVPHLLSVVAGGFPDSAEVSPTCRKEGPSLCAGPCYTSPGEGASWASV